MHTRFTFLPLLLAALTFSPVQALAAEDDLVRYGDWGYKCEKSPEGEQELCFIFQNVTQKETGQLVLGARIAYRPEQTQPMLVLTVPLGSLLPPGAALTMEGVEPDKITFRRTDFLSGVSIWFSDFFARLHKREKLLTEAETVLKETKIEAGKANKNRLQRIRAVITELENEDVT